ncbi:hypothetical protein C8J56DRAFT_879603 [Mycena floridula]|nr:hypothetical protein C8J56DRAFT_879603 [Mycena floridula]
MTDAAVAWALPGPFLTMLLSLDNSRLAQATSSAQPPVAISIDSHDLKIARPLDAMQPAMAIEETCLLSSSHDCNALEIWSMHTILVSTVVSMMASIDASEMLTSEAVNTVHLKMFTAEMSD